MIYEFLSMPLTSVALQLIDHVSFCLLSRECLLEKMNGEESSWPSQTVKQDSRRTRQKQRKVKLTFLGRTTLSTSSFSAIRRIHNTENYPPKSLQTMQISVSAFAGSIWVALFQHKDMKIMPPPHVPQQYTFQHALNLMKQFWLFQSLLKCHMCFY